MTIFSGGDMAALGINVIMVMFRNDKNTRKKNRKSKPTSG
jgi:hypothetical protein